MPTVVAGCFGLGGRSTVSMVAVYFGSSPSGSPITVATWAEAAVAAPQPQAAFATEPVASIATFEDMLKLIERRRDIALKLDVERYVRPISFRPGAIEYEPAPGAPTNLAQRLVGRLKEWTGERWLIAAQGGGGAESLWEKQKREAKEVRAEIEQDPFIRSVMAAFPGTEIVEVRTIAAPQAPEGSATEVEEDDDED